LAHILGCAGSQSQRMQATILALRISSSQR
jgi:hypothetical protein